MKYFFIYEETIFDGSFKIICFDKLVGKVIFRFSSITMAFLFAFYFACWTLSFSFTIRQPVVFFYLVQNVWQWNSYFFFFEIFLFLQVPGNNFCWVIQNNLFWFSDLGITVALIISFCFVCCHLSFSFTIRQPVVFFYLVQNVW